MRDVIPSGKAQPESPRRMRGVLTDSWWRLLSDGA
jgi:hypothetical protein